VVATDTHAAIDCSVCHLVPDETGSPGHADSPLPAEVVLTDWAAQPDRSPSYDYDAHTCTDTFCHGADVPTWVRPREAAAICGSCHGLPPPTPHPASPACSVCHSNVDDSLGFADPGHHVNGSVEL
jgi:predicted CxxxxCH...CXXCH cytochrome family protein